MTKYIIDRAEYPTLFLPDSVDLSNLIDITTINNTFKVFIDNSTFEVYDCEKYFNEYLKSKIGTDLIINAYIFEHHCNL